MLAEILVQRGHTVVWWNSTFDHVRKVQRFEESTSHELGPRLSLRLLHGRSYRRNVSLQRFGNHREIARQFESWITREPSPDLILCSVPNLELAVHSTAFGKARGIPVVLDLRDMWPDIFEDLLPRGTRWLAGPLFARMHRELETACRDATALTGITPEFVDWGLKAARRSRKPEDRSFWLGYSATAPAEQALSKAAERWRSMGIIPGQTSPVACYLGVMSGKLEMEVVIDAARHLSAEGDPLRFFICGTGDLLERYRKRARGLSNVVFPGWVNAAEAWILLRSSMVGLAPYRSRADFMASIPTKAVEYLSAGLPIVSSLQGSLKDLLATSGAGVTYPNGDLAGLVNLLREFSSGRIDRGEMAAKALTAFQTDFVAERVYLEMARYLEQFANR